MNNKHHISEKPVPTLAKLVATALGAGFCPKAPGTAGAAVGVIVWILLGLVVPIDALDYFTAALIIIFTVWGTWATAVLMPFWGDDPKEVVIDEVVGVWTALLAAPAFELENRIWMALAAFVLFRFFDIVKPLGIGTIDRKGGAFYVMADDLMAGLYALIILLIIGNIPGWII